MGRWERLRSRRVVIGCAVASQVVIIGVILAAGVALSEHATASLPAAPDAGMAVWVSDPNWHVAPQLTVAQNTWEIGLAPPDMTIAGINPNAEAVVVLWGAARLSDPHPLFRPLSAAAPGSYRQIRQGRTTVPAGSTFPGTPLTAQVFIVTARNYFSTAPWSQSRSILPVYGTISSSLSTKTATGWSAYIPHVEVGGVSLVGGCRASRYLPPAIAKVVPARVAWYGDTCPTPAATVQLELGENETLAGSSIPATSLSPANGDPIWTSASSSTGSGLAGYFSGFWVNVSDPGIAAVAQRDLLLAGILYGLAGGIAAAWIVAGTTYAVSRAAKGKADAEPGEPESAVTAPSPPPGESAPDGGSA